jgi:cephalosporin hydroxylase
MIQTVLVCGGRAYKDRVKVYEVLDMAHAANPIGLLLHGGARGADALADEWQKSRAVRTRRYNADWLGQGRAAGVIRNQLMLVDGKPDLVIAFPGGRGTADMIRRAKAAGVPVAEIS